MRTLLKIIGIVLVLIVAAAGVMFVIGSRLPREHIATASLTIAAPQGKVWSLMEDLSSQTHWRTGLKSVAPSVGRIKCEPGDTMSYEPPRARSDLRRCCT